MSSVPHLSVVRIEAEQNETPAARARRLYAEAQMAAHEQVVQLEQALMAASEIAKSIAEGGEVYPAGVRDLCSRLAEDVRARNLTLEALASRSLPHS